MRRSTEIEKARETMGEYVPHAERMIKAVRVLNGIIQDSGVLVIEDGEEFYYYNGEVNLSAGDNYEAHCPEHIRELMRHAWGLSAYYFAGLQIIETAKERVKDNPQVETAFRQVMKDHYGQPYLFDHQLEMTVAQARETMHQMQHLND